MSTEEGQRVTVIPQPLEPRSSTDEPCCEPGACDYTPFRVARYLRQITQLEAMGYEPCEALYSFIGLKERSDCSF